MSPAGASSEAGVTSSAHLMSIDEMSSMDEQALMELSQRVARGMPAKNEHKWCPIGTKKSHLGG